MSQPELKSVLEAALLAAGKSLTLAELGALFEEHERPSVAQLREGLAQLTEDYVGRAIELKETGAGVRVQVRREFAPAVARLWPERPQRYSRALLETLALIAYRQPITRAEIEAVRGVAVNPNIIKTLLERQWIRVVGHRDLPGRPELLGTTREFLEYFGLKNLEELPPLEQLRALGELDPQLSLPVSEELAGEADGGESTVIETAAVAIDAGVADDEDDLDPAESDDVDADETDDSPGSAGLVAAPSADSPSAD
jgi:segregation and condensation protein B